LALLGQGAGSLETPPVAAPAPAAPAPTITEPAPAAPAAGRPLTPIRWTAADAQGRPPLAGGDGDGLAQAVTEWLGRERTLRFVATDALARRIAATVDNLARSQAASRLWPLHPVGGRMAVTQTDDGRMEITPANAARYEAVVRFVVGLDVEQAGVCTAVSTGAAAGLKSWAIGRRFNDRLVAVIDHLLQTPEPPGPLALKLVQVQGQLAPQQPWLRYELPMRICGPCRQGRRSCCAWAWSTPAHQGQLRALRAQITRR
jgi:hypothetical protein